MGYRDYTIVRVGKETADTFILLAKPVLGEVFPFSPGQFAGIENPEYPSGQKNHFFSIASSPNDKVRLKFCFKVYGDWTKRLSEKNPGDRLRIAGPFGKFMWHSTVQHAVFLAGGIGITPFVSMLRYIKEANEHPSITLLYGNRTEKDIVYRSFLEETIRHLPGGKIIHILSHLTESDIWEGYRGFLTKEILEKEVTFNADPTFFICGPPIFVQLAEDILKQKSVAESKIRRELF